MGEGMGSGAARLWTRAAVCLLLAAPVHAAQLAGSVPPVPSVPVTSVAICEDENEWPPYSYFARNPDGGRTNKVIGYAVDVIGEILERHKISYRIDMIPWQRCLAVARMGKQYQMTLNMSWSPERARDFLFSRPYYSTTNYYYYSRRRYPQGLALRSAADLHNYRVCGIRGYNYSGYGGLRPGEVDQGASDFGAMIAKLHMGRCALFVEKYEVMLGYGAIGKDYLADPDLAFAPIPNSPAGLFHLAVPRAWPQAEPMMRMLDAELLRMEVSGRLKELWTRASAATPRHPPAR
jgi:polar amino acid transport system substrate-binding protein